MKALGSIENCRSKAQLQEMNRTIMKGVCCFCHVDSKLNPTLKETAHWQIIVSAFRYRHTKTHVMIIPKRHWTKISEITTAAQNDFFRILKWAEKNLILPGGGMFVRLGKRSHSSGTIAHLHFQLVVPTLRGPLIALFAKARNARQAERLARGITKTK